MFLNILKKAIKAADKPKVVYIPMLEKVMVYAKITDCSKHYIVHNYKTNKREIVMKGESLMTEEEKEAIEELKRFINKYEPFVFYSKQKGDTAEINPHIRMYENYKTILNLIEKQQKEIETLSTQNAKMSERHFRDSEKLKNSVSKDKIREKQIEREFELQQKYKDFEKDNEWNRYKELLEE